VPLLATAGERDSREYRGRKGGLSATIFISGIVL
jgi:hypothetical protein